MSGPCGGGGGGGGGGGWGGGVSALVIFQRCVFNGF